MQTVAVVDYGMGNVHSMQRALQAAARGTNVRVLLSRDATTLLQADRLVLPGQGAMRGCMQALQASGLTEVLHAALQRKPLLGVCVGMQMLLEQSAEGNTQGLGWLRGQVRRLQSDRPAAFAEAAAAPLKIPHMGWNAVRQTTAAGVAHPLWQGIADESLFYFVHSYYAEPADAAQCAASTEYGQRFCVALSEGLVFATQFHPEKSAAMGLQLLHNFLHWKP